MILTEKTKIKIKKQSFWRLIVILPGILFCACEQIALQSETRPEMGDCQACHLSPPPTGLHLLHLFAYRDSIITCKDCHSSSIKSTIWTHSVKRIKKTVLVEKWDTLTIDFPRFRIVRPAVKARSFYLCRTQVRDGRLLTRSRESLETTAGPNDSLELTDSSIIHFTFDSASNQFKEPDSYNRCRYSKDGDSIFQLQTDGFDSSLKTLTSRDSLIVREGFNRILVLAPDFNSPDTIGGFFIPPESTFLKSLDSEALKPVSYEFEGRLYVMQVIDSFYLRNTLQYDTALWHIADNIVNALQLDSSIEYQDRIFAENTAFHMNGKLDVQYPEGVLTGFREDTINITLDMQTGDTLFSVDSLGSWVPERQSCWAFSIWTPKCHIGLRGETFWHLPFKESAHLHQDNFSFRPLGTPR